VDRAQARLLALRTVGRLLAGGQPASPRLERLLLIRPDHLGDVLLTTPALAALRQALPAARLTLLVGPWAEQVARRGAAVDEVLCLDFPGFTRRPKRHLLQPYLLLDRAGRALRGRFDAALIFRPDHWWGALLAVRAGIPLRLGFATPTAEPLLTEALPLAAGEHVAALNLRLAERAAALAGGDRAAFAAPPEPRFELSDDERAWAAATCPADGRPLVALHAGSGSPLKNWPAPRWAAVADALAEAGARVALTGGPDDEATPLMVEATMRHPAIQLVGQTTLGQLGALFERASLVLGTDNGPLHLAAAVGAPTLRLYGPTDPALYGPWPPTASAAHELLTSDLACRPCGNIVAPPCGARQEPACLRAIAPSLVARRALALLEAGRQRPAPAAP
jgi:heptosyltransferase-2/heptosyltransferase-3